MKAHGVHKVSWQGSLSLVFVINNEIHLNQGLREFVREFVRNVLHIPSLVEEEEGAHGTQRWSGWTRVLAILLLVPSVLVFSMLGRRCCAAGMGERSWTEFAFGDSKRSPSHLFLYLCSFKENKSGKKKGLYQFWTPGSLNFIEWKNEKYFLKHLFFNFTYIVYFYFYLVSLFFFSYY